MFRQRRLEEDVLKKLLGEVTDPVEAYVRTVGDLAETVAIDDFYGFLRQGRGQIIDGTRVGGDDIIDGNVYESLSLADRANYTELVDSGFGSLTSAGKEASDELRTFARNPVYQRSDPQHAKVQPRNELTYEFIFAGQGFHAEGQDCVQPGDADS